LEAQIQAEVQAVLGQTAYAVSDRNKQDRVTCDLLASADIDDELRRRFELNPLSDSIVDIGERRF